MAANLKEVLLEEIALEGLDGITVNSLWVRLTDKDGFTLELDDLTKGYIWRCITALGDIEFYTLSKPRPDLVSYNRFHYLDPETKHFLETEHIPDDIYPIHLVFEDGVMGSCAEFKTRVNVTESIRADKPSLEELKQKYGNKLTIVASQPVRLRTLIGTNNDPSFEFNDITYAILERIGRARFNGETTIGKMSLGVFNQSSKTLFYLMKKLRPLNVLKKQRLCTVKKPSNVKISCFLYQLQRFYLEVGTRSKHELMNVATYLAEKKESMEQVSKIRADLKIFDSFKRITRLRTRSGDRIFVHIDIPYREVYPTATPKEYMSKNGSDERMIRHLKLLKTMDEIRIGVVNMCSMDSSDEDEDNEEEVDNIVSKITYCEVMDEPQVYQVLQVIKQAGSRGLSQTELRQVLRMTRLEVRRVVNLLDRLNYVKTVMMDKFRQKTEMFVAKDAVGDNRSHKVVMEQIQNLTDSNILPEPEVTPKPRLRHDRRAVPIILNFTDEEPSAEKADQIRKEFTELEDNNLDPALKKLPPAQIEQIHQLRRHSAVQVDIQEQLPERIPGETKGNQAVGLKRFTSITETHVRRANWILDVTSVIKAVESFKLLKLLRNREKEMHLEHSMDSKSVKRLITALIEEGRMRSYKVTIHMPNKSKEITYHCDKCIDQNHEVLSRMIDEAKLRYFSLSKDELNMRKKIAHNYLKETTNSKKKVEDKIPESARESIQKHQEYRRKLVMSLPAMKYNRRAGIKYGLLPKMLRLQTIHQYLFHLCYDTWGAQPITTVSTDTTNQPSTSTGIIEDKLDVKELQEFETDPVWRNEPARYYDEMTWRRYLPPLPVHTGYKKGWCLISDVLLIMPVYLFCRIVNVCYDIDGLVEILDHPVRRFFPVIHLPFEISQQLLHSKKYVQSFMEACGLLAEMGLLSFGREVLKDKEQTFVYLHQLMTVMDTRMSGRGYNKTRLPEDTKEFPSKLFFAEELKDLLDYWEFLQIVALSSNMGHKSLVEKDLEDNLNIEVVSLKKATSPNDPQNVTDTGVIPGDLRGAAGYDSSLFVHAVKNWTFKTFAGARPKVYTNRKAVASTATDSKRKVVIYSNSRDKKEFAAQLEKEKPHLQRKVSKSLIKSNKIKKMMKSLHVPILRKIKNDSLFTKRRTLKIVPKYKKKKPFEKGDEKDRNIYKARNKQRVVWTNKEDSTILMCKLATLIMDGKRKTSVILYTQIRDYLHEKCGATAADKSSQTVQRRLVFVMRNPLTESNILLFYREAMHDEFVLKNYVNKDFLLTDPNTLTQFKRLVDYLLDKFKSLDLQKCALPTKIEDLYEHHMIQYIGKLNKAKVFRDVDSKADVCHSVLRNILHCAVMLRDKHGRTHEMYKLLSQYPDILLSNVIRELRNDGLIVRNKMNLVEENVSSMQTGVGLRNFKVSQRYLNCFHKLQHVNSMFEDSATLFTAMKERFVKEADGDPGDNPYTTLPFKAGHGVMYFLLPLVLNRKIDIKVNMPDDLVIVDMEGFYNFPWGRGKTYGFSTKADKSLQEIQQNKTDKMEGQRTKNVSVIDKDMAAEMASPEKRASGEQTENGMEELSGEITVTLDVEGELNVSGPDGERVISDEAHAGSIESRKGDAGGDNGEAGSTSSLVTVSQSEEEIVLQVRKGQTESADGTSDMESPKKGERDIDSEASSTGPVKMTKKAQATLCTVKAYDNVKITEVKAQALTTKESMFEEIQSIHRDKMKAAAQKQGNERPDIEQEEFAVSAKEFTRAKTKRSEILIPKAEFEEYNMAGQASSLASRTLLSLRRAEDCSFDEIRVFNAQDNFVVKSCEIHLKFNDTLENAGTDGGEQLPTIYNPGPGSELFPSLQEQTIHIDKEIDQNEDSTKDGPVSKQDARSCEERGAMVEALLQSKHPLKTVWNRIQGHIPFKLDMDKVWQDLDNLNLPADQRALCTDVYREVEEHGELGVSWNDLRDHFPDVDLLARTLDLMETHCIVLKVGVTCTRYVALNLARPWVVHAYRNIKGRGLHAVEEGSDTVPIEECDIPGAEVIDQTDEPPDDQLDEQLEEPVSPHEDKIENLTDVTQVKHHLKGNLDKRKLVTNMAWTGPLSEEQAMRYKTVTEIQLASEGSSKLLETELAIEGRSKQLETDLASEGSSKQLETDLASEGSSKQLESDRVSEGSSKRLQTDMASGHIEKPLVGQEEERHDKVAQVILSGTNKEMAIDLQKIDAQEDFSKTCTKDQGKETDVASQSNNTLEGMEVSCTANRKRTVSKVITDSPTDIEPTSKRVKPSEEIVSSESSHKDNVDVQIINTEPGVPELETAPNPADSKDDACQERDVGASEKTQQAGNARSDEDQPEGTEGEQAASKQKRSLRKRRLSSSKEQTEDSKVQPVSTYDKVRLIIAPWRKPEGGINKPVLKMFLESVVLFLMHKPGADMKSISERYSPYLQPGMLRYLLDILEDIGCITRSYITSSKASLFSKYTPPVQDVYESEGSRMMIIPEADCVVKLGMFGLQFYPSVKWLAYTSTG